MNSNLNRTKAAVLNSSIASIGQILTLIAQFAARTFFIHFLGQQYLGLNGLFVNVLGFLNFAELGIGSAITFALYEPLANNNRAQISALMMHFKKWYQYIAVTVFVGGIMVMPFLPYLVHNQAVHFVNIYLAFLLALLNTVASYLVSYKRTLLIANQQGYINTLNTVGYSLIQQILQVVGLILFSNFYLYLLIQLIFMVISNLRVSHVVDKMYPYLQDYPKEKINQSTMKYFRKNIMGMLSAKVGGIVVNGTDNLLLSIFVGLTSVGLYSNYTLITTGLTNVLNQAVSAVSSSVGNLAVADKSSEHKQSIFYKYYTLSTCLVLLASVGFAAFSSTFINYWIGSKYIYGDLPLFLISFNFFLQGIRQPIITYTNAYGLYWYSRYKPIFESIINLVVSILLLKMTSLNVSAVLIGTICSNICINLWWEPLIVCRWGIKANFAKFMLLNIIYICLGAVLITSSIFVINLVNHTSLLKNIGLTFALLLISMVAFLLSTRLFSKDIFNLEVLKKILKRL